MAKLSRDLQALRAKLNAAKSTESVVSLQADGPGTVKLGLARSQNGPVAQVAIIFADPDTYPNAAVLLLCEGNDAFNSQLEDLSDEFQDGSDLAALVSAICARLDFPTCLSEGSTSSGISPVLVECLSRAFIIKSSSLLISAFLNLWLGLECLQHMRCSHALVDC